MARHRNVRSMKYDDDDDFDDLYGHSVEDDYCISPGTAAQFTYDRSSRQQLDHYMSATKPQDIPEEDVEYWEEDDGTGSEKDPPSRQDSFTFQRPPLSSIDEAKLNSCLEEMRNILGDTIQEHIMIDAVLKTDFSYEAALNMVLNTKEVPKQQRTPRKDRESKGGRSSRPADSTSKDKAETKPMFYMPGDDDDPSPAVALPDYMAQNVARMTFSTGTQAQSGFTPEKDSSASDSLKDSDRTKVDSAKKSLNNVFNSSDSKESESKLTSSESKTDVTKGGDVAGPSLSTPKKEVSPYGGQAPILHKSASKTKLERLDTKKEYDKRKADGKDYINLVVIGHVDAGKSTLMGHVLFQLGFVNKRTMHKYEQESKKLGKASFAYAWVLDETEEERARGVTMDVAQTRFETSTKIVTLLDAPGHKDFIPNMITGAAQADVAILVVNATRGEFETGFETGGQTREHAMLIRSLGVSQLVVAINKMDTVEWSEKRYDEITKKLGSFLKQAGFREADVSYVPCSGLSGENLCVVPKEPLLASWYKGNTLVQGIDGLRPPERSIDKPFRLMVSDVFKGLGAGFSVAGTIQAGSVQVGDRLVIMPQGDVANVRGIALDDGPNQIAFAGDCAVLTITGSDQNNIGVGSIMCDPAEPIKVTTRFRARVVIFNIDVPITKGFPVVLHYQSLSQPATVHRLVSQLSKSTGEIVKKKPRCLTKNSSAVIELAVDKSVCLELYKDYKELGRIMLRYSGTTIAAGLVTEILDKKGLKTE